VVVLVLVKGREMDEFWQSIQKHFANAGIVLSDEQAKQIAEMDEQYAALRFPNFAWHLCRLLAMPPTTERLNR